MDFLICVEKKERGIFFLFFSNFFDGLAIFVCGSLFFFSKREIKAKKVYFPFEGDGGELQFNFFFRLLLKLPAFDVFFYFRRLLEVFFKKRRPEIYKFLLILKGLKYFSRMPSFIQIVSGNAPRSQSQLKARFEELRGLLQNFENMGFRNVREFNFFFQYHFPEFCFICFSEEEGGCEKSSFCAEILESVSLFERDVDISHINFLIKLFIEKEERFIASFLQQERKYPGVWVKK